MALVIKSFPGDSDISGSWEPLPYFFVTFGAPQVRQSLMGKRQTLKNDPQVLISPWPSKKPRMCWCGVVSRVGNGHASASTSS